MRGDHERMFVIWSSERIRRDIRFVGALFEFLDYGSDHHDFDAACWCI
jgi:hypothetical protein